MGQHLEQAVAILKEGGVIAYPTDTVYGLGCDAFNEQAVYRVYRIKNRAPSQPFPILLANPVDIFYMAEEVSDTAQILSEHFWPGGLTLIVNKKPSVPDWITSGGQSLAVRVPNHPVALALIQGLGSPIIGTSANLSGQPNTNSARDVQQQLGNSVDFILDEGLLPGGIESTIVDATGEIPKIIRSGAVSESEIDRVLTAYARG